MGEVVKHCRKCKQWLIESAFGRDSSRHDGLASLCKKCRATGRPKGWPRPINPLTGRPGPAPSPARDGDKKQARRRINLEVRSGRRAHPNKLPCWDCGHEWQEGERRHEYDHFLGYGAKHHLDVHAVCSVCHRRRAYRRGEANAEHLIAANKARSARRRTHCSLGHELELMRDGRWRCRTCRLAYYQRYNKRRAANRGR